MAGVLVLGEKDVGAYVARAIGIPTFTVTTRATAVAGYLQGVCGSSQGSWCAVLPVTIPVNTVTCDGSNDVVPRRPAGHGTSSTRSRCAATTRATSAGSTGIRPPAARASSMCSIVNPDNPAITLPSWQYVAATGNTNGGGPCVDDDTGINYSGVEEAIRKYNGQIVLIPQFDMTCRT